MKNSLMDDRRGITWKQMSIIISIVVLTGGAVASYYKGISSAVQNANSYTDGKFNDLASRLDRIEDNLVKEIRRVRH